MMKPYADLVQCTSATTGTGALALDESPGWVPFSDRFAEGDRVYYMIESGLNKEVGLGTMTSGQLVRTTILGTLVTDVSGGTWTTGGPPLLLLGTSIVRSVVSEALLSTFLTAGLVIVTTNIALEAGKSYGVAASSLSLSLPSAPVANDRIEIFQAAAGVINALINPAGQKINGIAGNMALDVDNFGFWLTFVDTSYGWKVQQ